MRMSKEEQNARRRARQVAMRALLGEQKPAPTNSLNLTRVQERVLAAIVKGLDPVRFAEKNWPSMAVRIIDALFVRGLITEEGGITVKGCDARAYMEQVRKKWHRGRP